LRDVLLLRGEMGNECFLERGYFQERFFGVSIVIQVVRCG
jgi:hypothetical protein